jgi:hypothetical protein
MRLTNLEVLNAQRPLEIISQQKLPVKLSWKIATAMNALKPFAEETQKFISEVTAKYAIRDEMGNAVESTDMDGNNIPNTIQIGPLDIERVNTELSDLMKQTVEVSNVELSLADFPDTIEVEPAVMSGLLPLFTTNG